MIILSKCTLFSKFNYQNLDDYNKLKEFNVEDLFSQVTNLNLGYNGIGPEGMNYLSKCTFFSQLLILI